MSPLRALLLLLPLLALSCAVALRDANGYRLSVETHRLDAQEDARALLSLARSSTRCLEIAEIGLVRRTRADWRAAQELHNAGLGEDPGPRPPIPSPTEFCAGGAP